MRDRKTSLKTLIETPPWEWPADAAKTLLAVLRDDRTAEADRLLAIELAGDDTVISDELVDALLGVLHNGNASEDIRGAAAISLGPVLEHVDIEGFEDPDEDPITEPTFLKIQDSFRTLYLDAAVPKDVRRLILEASVRAPQDWHHDAIRAEYASNDEDRKVTAVFCMRFVRGFDEQILEALKSKNPEIHCEAVLAAGNWAVDAAWPHVAALVTAAKTPKPLLLAAIGAAASIRPQAAGEILYDLTDSGDEDIVEAVYEALVMAEGGSDEEEGDDDLF